MLLLKSVYLVGEMPLKLKTKLGTTAGRKVGNSVITDQSQDVCDQELWVIECPSLSPIISSEGHYPRGSSSLLKSCVWPLGPDQRKLPNALSCNPPFSLFGSLGPITALGTMTLWHYECLGGSCSPPPPSSPARPASQSVKSQQGFKALLHEMSKYMKGKKITKYQLNGPDTSSSSAWAETRI